MTHDFTQTLASAFGLGMTSHHPPSPNMEMYAIKKDIHTNQVFIFLTTDELQMITFACNDSAVVNKKLTESCKTLSSEMTNDCNSHRSLFESNG